MKFRYHVINSPSSNTCKAETIFESLRCSFRPAVLFTGKSYTSAEEESRRKSIWLVNKKMIEEHNKRADNGLESYTMGLNFFSDLVNKIVGSTTFTDIQAGFP